MKTPILSFLAISAATMLAGLYLIEREPGAIDLSDLRIVAEPGEQFSGGTTTIFDTSMNAFGRTPSNLTKERWWKFRHGKFVFERNFQTEEGSHSPVGPRFSAVSCKGCHFKDGRGRPPEGGETPVSMIVRLASVGETDVRADSVYGNQLDFYAVHGAVPEARLSISHQEVRGQLADGRGYVLQEPVYRITNPGYGPIPESIRISPRVAPATFGIGLLQAIPERDILARADADDRNNDGISGRPNHVLDRSTGRKALGRFGWKAGQPTVAQQVATAFNGDMGISSALYPEQYAETAADKQQYEIDDERLDRVTYYMTLVAPPGRREWSNPAVLRGKAVFDRTGCVSCHVAEYRTGVLEGFPEVSNQTIRPYSDLLLHDMGENLADHFPESDASGREWKTPPLWGLGMISTVSGHTRFLHDGRARNIEEAILWHGGEAENAQSTYRRLRAADRQCLLRFLNSL